MPGEIVLDPQVRTAVPGGSPATLAAADLHACVSDPLMESMNLLNEVTLRYPKAISFAPGRPYEGWFDTGDITRHLDRYLAYLRDDLGYRPDQVRTTLFQYGRTNGNIHQLVARTLHNDEGIDVPPESVVVTVGCQEGMLLTLRALITGPSDVLLVSSPCYIGITGAARLLDIEVVAVPEGERGLQPEQVRAAAARVRAAGKRPRACYLVPDFANPSGRTMPVEERRRLLAVAAEEDLYVLEDNPYGFFSRDDELRPTLKSLDRDRRVVYLGSFAKTCFPGARVGYVVADQSVVAADGSRTLLADELSKIKSMVTVNTPPLSQAVVGGMLLANGCRLRQANHAAIAFYRDNLNTLLAELARHFPAERAAELGVGWNVPDGGFFLLMSVPFGADEAALERCAQEYQVIWTPMSHFYLDGGGTRQLRLSCSYLDSTAVVEGVRRLAAFITDQARRAG